MTEIHNKIVKLFPQIEKIQDQELREKVIRCWESILKESLFSAEDLDKIPFTLLIQPCPFDLVTHTRAVTETSLRIAEVMEELYGDRIKINTDYLIAGAILHDVGKVLEYSKDKNGYKKSKLGRILRHPILGASVAYKIGIPEEIVHIIAAHSKEGELVERSLEAVIVHHADFLNFEPFKI